MKRLGAVLGAITAGLLVVTAVLALSGASLFSGHRTESVPWRSAVVSDDGRMITVTFIGAEEFHQQDPCHVDYSIRATEHDNEVHLTVEGREKNVSKLCTLAGMLRQLSVEVSSPLAGRPLVDGHDGRTNVVRSADGACLQPRVHPSGSREEAAASQLSTTSTVVPSPPPIDECDA